MQYARTGPWAKYTGNRLFKQVRFVVHASDHRGKVTVLVARDKLREDREKAVSPRFYGSRRRAWDPSQDKSRCGRT